MPDGKDWRLYDIAPETKRYARLYAAEYGLTLSEAVNELVAAAYALHKEQKEEVKE
jgi:hypothetical protein